MIRERSETKYYKAQGFVEALIAIVVAGIATLVLMTVAIRTLNSVVKNELIDQLTQEAVKGGELLNYAVDEYNYGNLAAAPFLPLDTDAGGNLSACYFVDGEIGNLNISSQPINGCTYEQGVITQDDGTNEREVAVEGIIPSECVSDAVRIEKSVFYVDDEKDDLFRVMCIHPDSTESVLIAKVITGNMTCESVTAITSETIGIQETCNMYEYTGVYFVESL